MAENIDLRATISPDEILQNGVLFVDSKTANQISNGSQSILVQNSNTDLSGQILYLSDGNHAFGTIELNRPVPMSIAEFRKRVNEHCMTDEARKEQWPRSRRLYASIVKSYQSLAVSIELDTSAINEELLKAQQQMQDVNKQELEKLSPATIKSLFNLQSVNKKLLSALPSTIEKILQLSYGSDDNTSIFAEISTLPDSLMCLNEELLSYTEACQAVPVEKSAAEDVSEGSIYSTIEHAVDILNKLQAVISDSAHIHALLNKTESSLYKLLVLQDAMSDAVFVAPLEEAQQLQSVRISTEKAEEPEGKLPVLKMPDPEFNVKRLKGGKPTGVLSRLPRASREGIQQFLVNELGINNADTSYIWGVIYLEAAKEFEALSKLPEGLLEGIDEYSRQEFSTESTVYYMPMKLVAAYTPPKELKAPSPGRRYGASISIPQALAKCEIEESSEIEDTRKQITQTEICKAGASDAYAPVNPSGKSRKKLLAANEVLDHFHNEFVLRSPFVYMVGSTANTGSTTDDIDILIKGPLDPVTNHIVRFRLEKMLPPNLAKRLSFHDSMSNTDDILNLNTAGPYTAHTALYDLIVRRRDDYRVVVEMRDVRHVLHEHLTLKTLVSKASDPLMQLPKEEGKFKAVLQQHFRGDSVHGDLRIKYENHFVGMTLAYEKPGAINDIESLEQAKKIAASFDPNGSSWNKPLSSPDHVYATPKAEGPEAWINIKAEAFPPGEIGASANKWGYIVATAYPQVSYGTQTPEFHEYFMENDPKMQGIIAFRKVTQGADGEPYWIASITKSLVPSVLKTHAVETGKVPPKGYSALPPSIKRAVPQDFQYWNTSDESERRQIRDALVAEKMFTDETIKLIDGEFKHVVKKYYVVPEPKESVSTGFINVVKAHSLSAIEAISFKSYIAECNEHAESINEIDAADLFEQFEETHSRLTKALKARHRKDKCMMCDESPEVEAIWADGRGRIWMCQACFDKWLEEDDRELVKQRKIANGVVGNKYGEAALAKNASEILYPDVNEKPSQEALTEAYEKYFEAINMTYDELKNWSETICTDLVLLDRKPIECNLRLLLAPKEEWINRDINWAKRTTAFIAKTLKDESGNSVRPGCLSKRDISLKNWAFDVAKAQENQAAEDIGNKAQENQAVEDIDKDTSDLHLPNLPSSISQNEHECQQKNVEKSLSVKNEEEFKKETEIIRENQKTDEAKKPHKFKAAKWTHPNGHPRCLICGDEEPENGMCEGVEKRIAKVFGEIATTEAYGHSHTVYIDSMTGNGITDAQIEHSHEVLAWEIMQAFDGHTHQLQLDSTIRNLLQDLRPKLIENQILNDVDAQIKRITDSDFVINGIAIKPDAQSQLLANDTYYNLAVSLDSYSSEMWKDTLKFHNQIYLKIGVLFPEQDIKLHDGMHVKVKIQNMLLDVSNAQNYKVITYGCIAESETNDVLTTVSQIENMLSADKILSNSVLVKDSIAKAIGEQAWRLSVTKMEEEQHYVLGVVLVPNEVDAHGDIYDAETVEKACHYFMEHAEKLGLMHCLPLNDEKIKILENYIAPVDFTINSQSIKKGTWILAARVKDNKLWQKVKNGELTGWSIQGSALASALV